MQKLLIFDIVATYYLMAIDLLREMKLHPAFQETHDYGIRISVVVPIDLLRPGGDLIDKLKELGAERLFSIDCQEH
jgi:hypothetical protein